MKTMSLVSAGIKVLALLSVLLIGLGGCAERPDPFEKTNRVFYSINDSLDKHALKPVAHAYVKVVPEPVRTSLSHAYDNLGYANVWTNDFLQGKWKQGWSDVGRMAVNSTIGVLGFFDVATQWGMVAHDNDFGITMGKWGAEPGPYLVIPLLGPSSVRDAHAIPVSILTNPLTYAHLPIGASIGVGVGQAIDGRARVEKEAKFRDDAAIDPYIFVRNAYLQYREAQIKEGKAPASTESYDDSDAGAASQPATSTTRPATAPASTQPAGNPALQPGKVGNLNVSPAP